MLSPDLSPKDSSSGWRKRGHVPAPYSGESEIASVWLPLWEGLLEHSFLLVSFCAVKKPKKPCGEVHLEPPNDRTGVIVLQSYSYSSFLEEDHSDLWRTMQDSRFSVMIYLTTPTQTQHNLLQ